MAQGEQQYLGIEHETYLLEGDGVKNQVLNLWTDAHPVAWEQIGKEVSADSQLRQRIEMQQGLDQYIDLPESWGSPNQVRLSQDGYAVVPKTKDHPTRLVLLPEALTSGAITPFQHFETWVDPSQLTVPGGKVSREEVVQVLFPNYAKRAQIRAIRYGDRNQPQYLVVHSPHTSGTPGGEKVKVEVLSDLTHLSEEDQAAGLLWFTRNFFPETAVFCAEIF